MKSEEKMALAWVVIIIGLIFFAQCQPCGNTIADLYSANSPINYHT